MKHVYIFIVLVLFCIVPVSSVATEDSSWDGFTFEMDDLDGDELTEEEVFSGAELYLVDFWASWCRPCSQYLPHLEIMMEDYGDLGLKVVIFCVDDAGTMSTARATLQAEDYPFTILFDPEGDIQSDLCVRAIPTTVLFSPDGEELWRHVGYASGAEDEVREEIEENLPVIEE